MKTKAKPRNKAFDQMRNVVILIGVVLVGVMWIQNNDRTGSTGGTEVMATATPAIISRDVFDDLQRVQVVFRTGNTKDAINGDLQRVACAERANVPAGYDLRLAGKYTNNMTQVDAVLGAAALAGLDCGQVIDWEQVAESYEIASGAR